MASRSRDVQPLRDQPVAGGVEVVEHVLLVGAATGVVPGLAVLVARHADRRWRTRRRRAPRGGRGTHAGDSAIANPP